MGRFLLIGLDGAEPELLSRWMDAGHLPTLANLREKGAFLRLRSTVPPATFPAWASCVTGVNPGRHGVIDFTEIVPGTRRLRFVNSAWRRAPAVWETLSEAGKRVCVLGVPATYPPDAVNGVMVAGFDSPVATGIDRGFVHPPEAYDRVKDWRFADVQESHIGPGWHDAALARLLTKIGDKERIAKQLLESEPWDFAMLVFSESDTVAHHFWLFHDVHSPRHMPGPADAIQRVYERLDQAVGVLADAMGPGVTVGVCSDHGFGGAGTGVVHLNNWLAENGYLAFTGSARSLLKALALKWTPQRLRGRLFRRFRGLASRAEAKSRFGGIDWSRTTAWSEELNYFPSIRVNLAGRDPNGQVAPADYDAFCRDLCAQLEAWAPIHKAWRRDELYDGPYIERAPDIVLELALEDGYSHSCLRSRGGPPFRRLGPDERYGGKERGMTGNHRPEGVCLLSRPTPAGFASIQDIAPAILAEIGVPGPPMDGVSLLEPAEETQQAAVARHGSAQTYSPAEEEQVARRLRKLGYFE